MVFGAARDVDGHGTTGGDVVIGADYDIDGDLTGSGMIRIGPNTDIAGDLPTTGTVLFEDTVSVDETVVAAPGQRGEYTDVDDDADDGDSDDDDDDYGVRLSGQILRSDCPVHSFVSRGFQPEICF